MNYTDLTDDELLFQFSKLKSNLSKKHNTQMALKILMNAEYGAFANKYFRYFDLRLASAITLTGQLVIQWIEQYLKDSLDSKYKIEVIYQDTDSSTLTLAHVTSRIKKKYPKISNKMLSRKIDKFCNEIISPIIENGYEELSNKLRCNENKFVMKREKIADRAFFLRKKRYAMNVWNNEGVEYDNPKLNITGLDIVRSDTPPKVRTYLRNALNKLILSPSELKKYIKEVKKIFYNLKIEDISKPMGVKGIKKYSYTKSGTCAKGTPIHVRGAIVYNNYITQCKLVQQYPLIEESTKAKFVYLKKPNNLFNSHVLTFVRDFPNKKINERYVDYDKMFNLTFLNKIVDYAHVAKVDVFLDDEKKVKTGDIFE